ncbi:hypothetical protein ACFQI7_21390 [Paenibacillus allorhizosphaerae]|uniref:Uncharacterized protein n=1 Tax=Paenibacillus allorhizosphaerae TaxID=2849866 RepID=A0ABM8VN82_9BACL|nr:hypothetical protein [Paenibacillus allorhizosphaerae]CAG7651112.1 hypothetical protein PAECIP111802_04889 [Paenibacillus allorhizosphaerae]
MNFNKKLMILVKICLFMFTLPLISACSQTEKYETIEVFAIETLDDNQNDKGFFERTGYKIVNAITTIEEGKTHMKSDIKSIEDFYDIRGNYLQTEIIHSYSNKSKLLLTEEGNTLKETIQEPSTILIAPDYAKNIKLNNMTQEEKNTGERTFVSFHGKIVRNESFMGFSHCRLCQRYG